MLYSLVNNNFEKAIKGNVGICPLCTEEVLPKCGEINIHHWAHKVKCTYETEPMTEWHIRWQELADQNGLNVHFYDWKEHIPDAIDLNLNRIFEFQNSPITQEDILKRCVFYKQKGFKTIWIFNFSEKVLNGNLKLKKCDEIVKFTHLWQRKYIQSLFKWEAPYYGKVFFDFGELLNIQGYHGNGNGWGIYIDNPESIFLKK